MYYTIDYRAAPSAHITTAAAAAAAASTTITAAAAAVVDHRHPSYKLWLAARKCNLKYIHDLIEAGASTAWQV
jgi:hypothetical protein